jgi:hypothetical protein
MYKVFSGSINKYKRLKETSVAKAEKGQILWHFKVRHKNTVDT